MLKRIASHFDADVQIIAGASLLAIDEQSALSTLERIANTAPGLASLTASMTIHEWRALRRAVRQAMKQQ